MNNLKNNFMEIVSLPPLGLKILWEQEKVQKISLFWSEKEKTGYTEIAQKMKLDLKKYLSKINVTWDYVPIAWDRVSSFRKKVYKKLKDNISFGRYISYGELARLCSNSKGARAVGNALRLNPWPLVIPCHRVLKKDGSLGGFSCGLEIKKFLLELEGIGWKE